MRRQGQGNRVTVTEPIPADRVQIMADACSVCGGTDYYCAGCLTDWKDAFARAVAAMRYVESRHISYSQAAEMWAFLNGYDGEDDIMPLVRLVEREDERG